MDSNLIEQVSSSENKNICIECGLCCDGSMYPNVFIHNDDDASFIQLFGFDPVEVNGELSSPLPCKWQKDNLCTLYSDSRRLKSCKDYKCRLLEQYISEEISYATAMNEIKKLLELRNSIREFSKLYYNNKNSNEVLLSSFIDEITLGEKLNDPAFKEKYAAQIQDCLVFIKMIHDKMSSEAFESHINRL